MRKRTIFRYEFRRLMLSREYLLLLAAVAAYCASLLRGNVIAGTQFTAPFSPWTFCDYLASMTMLLLVLLLALCARQFSASERGAAVLIAATPMPDVTFRTLRYAAIACAYGIAAVIPVAACLIFYWAVFGYTAFGNLIGPVLTMLFPPTVLVFGAAMLLGKRKAALVYALMAAVLILGVFRISLPAFLDVFGTSVTQTLYVETQEFAFTPAFIAGRIAFVAAGAALSAASVRKPRAA